MSVVSPSDLPFGAVVSFEVYPAQMLGDAFTNAKVMAIVDADTAKYWIDPKAQHQNVYATLPAGSVPDKFDSYLYVKLKLASGMITAVGLPWIRKESLKLLVARKILITVENVSPEDDSKILKALSANGFSAAAIQDIT